jgi:hypothetical protein
MNPARFIMNSGHCRGYIHIFTTRDYVKIIFLNHLSVSIVLQSTKCVETDLPVSREPIQENIITERVLNYLIIVKII